MYVTPSNPLLLAQKTLILHPLQYKFYASVEEMRVKPDQSSTQYRVQFNIQLWHFLLTADLISFQSWIAFDQAAQSEGERETEKERTYGWELTRWWSTQNWRNLLALTSYSLCNSLLSMYNRWLEWPYKLHVYNSIKLYKVRCRISGTTGDNSAVLGEKE